MPARLYSTQSIVTAEEMAWEEYCQFEHTNPSEGDNPGYRIISGDDYTSWVTKDAFERTHRLLTDAEITMVKQHPGGCDRHD